MSKRNKPVGFMVLFDDESGYCCPMGADPNCEGALEASSEEVSVFPTRKLAQHAIQISAANARLREAQGKPANTDFTESRTFLKIVPLYGQIAQVSP